MLPLRPLLFGSVLLWLVLAGTAPSQPADPIKDSIARGVKALQALQRKLPPLHADNLEAAALQARAQQQPIGVLALQGLTFLECDVPAQDAVVLQTTQRIRQGCLELRSTYSLALAILFFDRLGDPADAPFIQALAQRLLAGQNGQGGWSYHCPAPPAEEVRRLTELLRGSSGGKAAPRGLVPPRGKGLDEKGPLGGVGDNSNTQFAVLGLWAARRHGVDVVKAFTRVEERFRKSQGTDGGWGYVPGLPSTPSMTCAGLQTLAMSHGLARELEKQGGKAPPALAKDRALRSGLLALGTVVGNNPGKGQGMTRGHYFLWSVERLAVALGLETIGNRNWHAWGAQLLLASQAADGAWWGEHGPDIDTCFALLFLRRVNLTKDLSVLLKGTVQDPGEAVLKGGGVGGEALLGQGLKQDIVLQAGKGGPPQVAGLDPEAARLCQELLQAPADRQPLLLDRLKEAKGTAHTDALAAAIPQLAGPLQTRARDALAERLTRMTAATLRGKLAEDDVEVRVAAIQACVNKEDKAYVPDLIPLLADGTERIARASHQALKFLTGQDFGPAAGAPLEARAKAAAAWQAWWQKQK